MQVAMLHVKVKIYGLNLLANIVSGTYFASKCLYMDIIKDIIFAINKTKLTSFCLVLYKLWKIDIHVL